MLRYVRTDLYLSYLILTEPVVTFRTPFKGHEATSATLAVIRVFFIQRGIFIAPLVILKTNPPNFVPLLLIC